MKVRLQPHTPAWAAEFARERGRLAAALGDELLAIEHFGSTAVEGLPAKPVIDVLAVVRDIRCADGLPAALAALGYTAAGPWGIPGRRLFRKGSAERTHHLHVYQVGDPDIDRHLVVRDYLRGHADERARYAAQKQELAAAYPDTRAYSPAKKAYVAALEQRALAWAQAGRSPSGDDSA